MEGPHLDERALVEQARAGDMGAFEQLVLRYQDLAVRTAWMITGSAAEAEDAAQDGFVKAWAALGRFRPEAPFRPWLLQIVANEARNRRRAAQRRSGLALRAAEAQAGGAGVPDPEASSLDDERQQALLEAINRLREEERQVVACRYFLDLSEAETAAILGCPRGTVKSRLSRALGHLRRELSVTLGEQFDTIDGLERKAHG